jgi:phosphoribosylaminoimidazole-succinocarboxamide synthase
MLVKKAHVVPIECVARGYLAGSGWKEYQQSQSVCGVPLPAGLRQCDKLPEPIFTPATKEESGHDINISYNEVVRRIGARGAQMLRERTLSMYGNAADYGLSRGIIIADTKFEFGLFPPVPDFGSELKPELLIIDEVLTPDSSRFWPADQYAPGRDQPSFDKQFVRNWLEKQPWDKTPPAPRLPDDVVEGTRKRYVEAYERLAGVAWKS